MSAIINFKMNIELFNQLTAEQAFKGKKGTYVNLTMSVEDESRYGDNCGIFLSQTKEEREAKTERLYFGNGRVAWVAPEGIVVAEKESSDEVSSVAAPALAGDTDDLPF